MRYREESSRLVVMKLEKMMFSGVLYGFSIGV